LNNDHQTNVQALKNSFEIKKVCGQISKAKLLSDKLLVGNLLSLNLSFLKTPYEATNCDQTTRNLIVSKNVAVTIVHKDSTGLVARNSVVNICIYLSNNQTNHFLSFSSHNRRQIPDEKLTKWRDAEPQLEERYWYDCVFKLFADSKRSKPPNRHVSDTSGLFESLIVDRHSVFFAPYGLKTSSIHATSSVMVCRVIEKTNDTVIIQNSVIGIPMVITRGPEFDSHVKYTFPTHCEYVSDLVLEAMRVASDVSADHVYVKMVEKCLCWESEVFNNVDCSVRTSNVVTNCDKRSMDDGLTGGDNKECDASECGEEGVGMSVENIRIVMFPTC
jgi:hypothetical protein